MNVRVSVGHSDADQDIRDAVLRVLDSGRVSEGKETRDFEKPFVGSKHCTALMRTRESSDGPQGWAVTSPLTYAHLRKEYEGKLPHAEYIGANGFYTGCHQYLAGDDLQYVSEAFDKAMAKVLR